MSSRTATLRPYCTGTTTTGDAEVDAIGATGRLACAECGGYVIPKKDGTLRRHQVRSNTR